MNRGSVGLLLLAVGGSLCFASPIHSSTNSIMKVQIEGLLEAKGQICYSLFDRSQGFPESNNNVRAECLSVKERMPTLTIENLHLGTYALAVFHDINEDGEFNRNFLGIPQEGFGFSQNPKIQTSPLSFGESAVFVTGTATHLQVRLRYF